MNTRPVTDVSNLSTNAYGHHTPQWWGVVGMIAIEGTIFALCVASYFYLRLQSTAWPPRPTPIPDLTAGSINTVLILAGAFLMRIVERHALRLKRTKVLLTLFLFTLLTAIILVIRFYEFQAFHVKWDTHAYGSIVWITLIFHSLHLLTTFFEKSILFAYISLRHMDEQRALDLQLNRVYWDFVAASWLVLYAVLYFGPRVLN